ncbi:MAG: hypothetical protein Q8S01_01680, partial [Ignavibacteria bacterium]|nr:hypothetical protein [Ignavibacteria bacterium]
NLLFRSQGKLTKPVLHFLNLPELFIKEAKNTRTRQFRLTLHTSIALLLSYQSLFRRFNLILLPEN